MVEVKAPDSDELSLKVYGYVKPITPAELNNFIDLAVERIQQQELEGYDLEEHHQEYELSLDEIETSMGL